MEAEERRNRCANMAFELIEDDLTALMARKRPRELTGQELNRLVQYVRVLVPMPVAAAKPEEVKAPGLHLDLVKRLAKTAGQ